MFNSLAEANATLEKKDLQIQELTKKLQSTQLSLKMPQHQVKQLLRRVYGRRYEKLDPNQLMFDHLIPESVDQPMPQPPPDFVAAQKVEKKKPRNVKRRHPGRIPIPEHLERVEIVLDIPQEQKVCPETMLWNGYPEWRGIRNPQSQIAYTPSPKKRLLITSRDRALWLHADLRG